MLLISGPWGVTDVRGMGHVLAKVCIKKGEINSTTTIQAKWYSMDNVVPFIVS